MPERDLVFDTGPLSHFAKEGWLGLLKAIAGDRVCYVPDVVVKELADGVDQYPHLRSVLEASWLITVPIVDLAETVAFVRYSSRLAVRSRNLGECGVLAVAEIRGLEAVIDDRAARKLADEHDVSVTGTLALLCQGVRSHGLSLELASVVADDLISGEYRLPIAPGGFAAWARENGLAE